MTHEQVLKAVGSGADVIVIIAQGESGESASSHHDWSEVDVVFKKAGNYFRATAHTSHDQYRSRSRNSLTDEKAITAADFDLLAAGHTPVNIAAIHAQQAQTAAAIADEEAARPNCPKCGKKMAPRTGRNGPFWGCSTFKTTQCGGTRSR